MARRKSKVEKLTEQLAQALAEENLEWAQEMYQSEVDDDIIDPEKEPEGPWVDSAGEAIYEVVHDGLAERLVDLAGEAYGRLITKTYGRKKSR